MGGIHTFLELEELTAETMNLYVSQNTVPKFATVAARDAAILAPVDGQQAFTWDTGSLWVYLAAKLAWWPVGWNSPRGLLATTYATATLGAAKPPSFSFGTSLAGTDPLGWSLHRNRLYRFDFEANVANGTVVTGVASIYLVANGAAVGTATSVAKWSSSATLQSAEVSGFLLWAAAATGNANFKVYAQASAGTTGGQTVSDVVVTCTDIGPNGNPA